MIDTSSSMLNSEMINTYYQLANGFVIVSDIEHLNKDVQMNGINDNIIKIRKVVGEEAKILLVMNDYQVKDKGLYGEVKKYADKNNISLLIEDIDKITNQEINFNKYIDEVLNVKSRKN